VKCFLSGWNTDLVFFTPGFQISLLENKMKAKSNWQPSKPHVDYSLEVLKAKFFEKPYEHQYSQAPFLLILPVERMLCLEVWGRYDPNAEQKGKVKQIYSESVAGTLYFCEPGHAMVLSPDCVHRTAFPLLDEKEKKVQPSPRIHVLIGASLASDDKGVTIQDEVYPEGWFTDTDELDFSMKVEEWWNKPRAVRDSKEPHGYRLVKTTNSKEKKRKAQTISKP
jgi:hypothetical protein